jgi:nucleoside-diphosphate-sugar epimerase/adenylate kinase family enzyme
MSLPPLPPSTRKAFVAYLDTLVGSQLAERLIAQGVEVSGIVRDPANIAAVPAKTKKAFRRNDAESVRRALLEADFVAFQLIDSAQDALSAIKLLTTNHYDGEKRFVLISSMMTWYETPPLVDPPKDTEDLPEPEAFTEDQYNRRIPHVKYLTWRESEKLVAASCSDRLKTFVVFAGLPYGKGEELLHPLFKQAWSLAAEGLPIYASGKQIVPMIHVLDLVTFALKLFTLTELPELRYMFCTDDGNVSVNDMIKAINTTIGNGNTFRVPSHEFALHDNIEQFILNLKVDSQTINTVMSEEEWTAKSGFVENITAVVDQYREARGITPIRAVVLGAPLAGKSFLAHELGAHYEVPVLSIADVIAEYKYQETELREELLRLRQVMIDQKVIEKQDERRQAILEERKAAREAAISEAAQAADVPNDDNDDVEEEEEIEVHLSADELKEIRDAVGENNDDERVQQINEKLEEIKKVLALKIRPAGDASLEPANPKDKKKAAPPPKKGAAADPKKPAAAAAGGSNNNAPADGLDDDGKDVRYQDRALAIMVRWKLTRTNCRNQGYILEGFPKTVKQARVLFEDNPIDVPDDAEDPEPPLEKEEKPCLESIFPQFVVHLKASDGFLLERLQRVQHESPHNNADDFQRRLGLYKQNFTSASSTLSYLESMKSVSGKTVLLRHFDSEQCPLVLPPPAKSAFSAKQVDPTVLKLADFIGKPHNFGPTPQDAHRELERQRLLQAEQQSEAEALTKKKKEKEALEVAQAQKAKQDELFAANQVKESERQMLEARKAPLKAYLMQQIVPVLTKGLVEVCNKHPEDPVDFLAEWLLRHNPEDDTDVYQ